MNLDHEPTSPSAATFSIKLPTREGVVETIKWSEAGSHYEIHMPILDSLELSKVVPHCMEFRDAIATAVDNAAYLGPSLYRVFPRTLSSVLRTVWDQLNADATINPAVDNSETSDHFDDRVREFIAVYSTEADRYDLVQLMRSTKKPMEVSIRALFFRLKQLNSYVPWIPGTEPQLSEDQLKQAFHDAMPAKWKERFTSAGHSVTTRNQAQMLHYFGAQEAQAAKAFQENQAKARRQNQVNRAQRRGKNGNESEGQNKGPRSNAFKK